MSHRPCLLFLVLALTAAGPSSAQLLLAGGSLPVCSSLSPAACREAVAWDAHALEAHGFEVTDRRIERWQSSLDPEADAQEAQAWLRLLNQLAMDMDSPVGRSDFGERIRALVSEADRETGDTMSGENLYQRLDDRAWWRLLDHFQQAPGDRGEQVRLDASRSQATIEIFSRFVAMAREAGGRDRPRIAISTASSRDPYDALDFYFQVFEQAGAEVFWLPLDRALTAARTAGRCADLAKFQAELLGTWDRARVYPAAFEHQRAICGEPETTMRLAEDIDGLFLNGGDQSLTLHAFVDAQGRPGPEWQRIMERLQAGDLVLGGTSAGAAVQSGPVMITNGSSVRALLDGASNQAPPASGCDRSETCPAGLVVDSLTYRGGGLGSFPSGIVDTHFSERWRQFRLLQLLVDTGQRLGLGIDETSAVEITGLFGPAEPVLTGWGEAGGWLIDLEPARSLQTLPLRLDGALLVHIAPGQRWSLESAKTGKPGGPTPDRTRSEDCSEARNHPSFSALANQRLPVAGQGPACVDFALDDRTAARSHFQPRERAEGPEPAIRAWYWSLEVTTAP